MIDALIAGKVHGQPTTRTGKSGKPFTVAKVRVANGEESIFVSVICFNEAASTALLTLSDGDSVALSGSMTVKVFPDRAGVAKPAIDMTASAVLTPYHVQRKRRAMQNEPQHDSGPRQAPTYPPDFPDEPLNF